VEKASGIRREVTGVPTVFIPPLLTGLTGGQTRLSVPGSSVQEVIDELEARFPGIAERLCEDGRIRPGMAVAVDSVVSTIGLRHHLSETSEVHFLPAISGGLQDCKTRVKVASRTCYAHYEIVGGKKASKQQRNTAKK
jgi:sulfur-carrier protein